LVSYGKPFVAIFKTDFLFISICKSQFFSLFQAICKARFTLNARFNIQWTIQCSMHAQYLLNHSMFNKTLDVQLVIQGFNNAGNSSAFSLISSVQCIFNVQWTIQCSVNYIMFNEQFNVQCIFNIEWTIQCLMHIQCCTKRSVFNELFKVSTLLGMRGVVLGMMVHFLSFPMFNVYSMFNDH